MIQIQIIKELTLTDHGHQNKTTYTIKRCRCTQPSPEGSQRLLLLRKPGVILTKDSEAILLRDLRDQGNIFCR